MLRIYSFLLLVILDINIALASSIKNDSPIMIIRVEVSPSAGQQFSAIFDFNTTREVVNWELGFFMLQVLHKPGYQLKMQICDKGTKQCSMLELDKKPAPQSLAQVSESDLTSGHVAILRPVSKLALIKAHSYQIRIDGMRSIPQNISMMPQGFFLLENGKAIPLNVDVYVSQNYNESAISSLEAIKFKERWQPGSHPISPIVPLPQKVSYSKGFLELESQIEILNNFGDSPGSFYVMRQLRNQLENKRGVKIANQARVKLALYNCDSHPIECEALKDNLEGYIISIKPAAIEIYAGTPDGLFYAYQSLSQLFYYYAKKLPIQEIIDYPEYQYRGLLVDTSRHFFGIAELKRIIDVMAAHKLNILHLHLADDEGWRIALAGFPTLTAKGSIRYQGYKIGPSNLIDAKHDITNYSHLDYENAASNYGGYYSVPQILDLISYANLQSITIIPEIEMPGHARSLKKSLPDLYDFSKPASYLSVQGYNDNVLPVYKYGIDEGFTMTINGMTTELANLFSGQFVKDAVSHEISLSADEVPAGAYPESMPVSQTSQKFFMQLSEQLPDYKISGWQQMVQGDDGTIGEEVISPDHVGHIWSWVPLNNSSGVSGTAMTRELLEANYPVVADFADYAYLDIRYSQKFNEPGLYWSTPYIDTWKTFMLGRQVMQFKQYKNMLGVEGALWTELVPSSEHLWYMLVPKLAGIAEAGWSNPSTDNWAEFSQRLGCGKQGFLAYLFASAKIRYRGYPNGIALELPPEICVINK